jgi:hypothetical protein
MQIIATSVCISSLPNKSVSSASQRVFSTNGGAWDISIQLQPDALLQQTRMSTSYQLTTSRPLVYRLLRIPVIMVLLPQGGAGVRNCLVWMHEELQISCPIRYIHIKCSTNQTAVDAGRTWIITLI